MYRTRSSARKTTSRGSKPEDKSSINNSRDPSTSDEDETAQRQGNPKKRKKLTRKKPQTQAQSRRNNNLSLFTQFPIDVLFEIFGHLMPRDILRLSRTSKDLHALLTTRSSAFAWKLALANVKPPTPPCPTDLNVMQYVNVLYGEHCSFCGSEVEQVEYALYLRRCDACTIEHSYLNSSKGPSHALAQSLCMIFNKYTDPNFSRYILKTEFDDVVLNLQNFSTDEILLKQYIKEKEAFKNRRCKFAYDCMNWVSDAEHLREQEVRAILDARSDLMLSKLKDLGWSKEIEHLTRRYYQSKIPGISIQQPLTEKEWTSLKPRVLTFLEGIRAEILENERNAVLWERFQALKKVIYEYRATQKKAFIVRPNTIDFLAMEPIQSLIFDTKLDQKLSEDDFGSLKPHLLDISASIKESQDVVLVGLLPKLTQSRGRDTTERKLVRLNLATTFFACRGCSQPIMYPRVLVHSCFYKHHEGSKSKVPKLPYNFRAYGNIAPWNLGGNLITFNDEISNIATTIVTLYGEDPRTATVAHMDELDVRLECLRCRGRQVMKWRIAVCHELERHPRDDARDSETGWRKLDKEEFTLVHAIEDKQRCEEEYLECDLCYEWIERVRCREHLIKTHHLADVKNLSTKDIEMQFSIPCDQSMKQRPYAVKMR